MRRLQVVFLVSGAVLTSCVPTRYTGKLHFPIWVQEGLASWYGPEYQGQLTASGRPFDMYAMTAAHRTLPLGAKVLVQNLENGREVVVEITDRGPYVDGRIIDLSYGAAKKLGMIQKGVVRVRIRLISLPRDVHPRKWDGGLNP